VAIVATTAVTAVLALAYDFIALVEMASLTVLLQYLSTCLAVPILRRRRPPGPQSWLVPGGVLLPLLGATGCVILILRSAAGERVFVAWAVVAGVAVAVLSRRAARSQDG
jgi:amino acid transporter